MKMQNFDLEKAKNGRKVCTREGNPVRILCFDRIDNSHPIIALVYDKNVNQEIVHTYNIKGRMFNNDKDSVNDLMIIPEEKSGWINVYKHPSDLMPSTSQYVYESKEAAEEKICFGNDYIGTFPITWEE